MHLIKNKNASTNSSTKSPQINKNDLIITSGVGNKNSKTNRYKPITQRAGYQTQTGQKSQSLMMRAFSNTKSIINKIITKQNQSDAGGKKIGEKYVYLEEDLIGKGYSSQVYKCAHVSNLMNKNLAVKILDLSKIKGFLFDLLKKEISIHKKLDHQNVVKCFDVIETKSHIYIIQQFCSGGDLGTYISQRKKKIPQGQALKIMSQIVDGYKYLIKQNILHRDLKPCNIFRCGKNKVWKIGDFGFSCVTTEQVDDVNVGTPIYMPPQSLENSLYSHKSDFFALGVIMYEMIYGKVPWFSKSQSLLVKKMKEIKLSLEGQNELIKNSLIKRFIEKCCEIEKQKRISQEQFLKLELFPKQGLNIQRQGLQHKKSKKSPQKSNSKDLKIKTSNSKQKKLRSKLKTIVVVNANSSLHISTPNNSNITALKDHHYKTQQKGSQIQKQKQSQVQKHPHLYLQKKSKLSQYSTQPQTRVLSDQMQVKSALKTQASSNLKSQQADKKHVSQSTNHHTASNNSQSFKQNNQILYKQIQFCKHLYYMIKNINYFNIQPQKRQYLTIVVYKHIIYLLKKLKNTKFNYFELKKWQHYRESKYFVAIQKQVGVDLELVEKEYFKHLKHKDIRLLREVNGRFPELSHDADFNMKFYSKIVEYLRQLIHDFCVNNKKIVDGENLDNGKLNENSKIFVKHQNFFSSKDKDNNKLMNSSSKNSFHRQIKSPVKKSNFIDQKVKSTNSINQPAGQNNKKTGMKTGQMIKAKAIKNMDKYEDQTVKAKKQKAVQSQAQKVTQNILKIEQKLQSQIFQAELKKQIMEIKSESMNIKLNGQEIGKDEDQKKQVITLALNHNDNIIQNPILTDDQYSTLPNNIQQTKQQPFQQPLYEKVPHPFLVALQSLFQYYMLMQAKHLSNKDIHTSFSVVNLEYIYQDENILTLVRDFATVKLKQEDVARIRKLTSFL